VQEVPKEEPFDLGALMSNPLVLILLMTIPALLIIFAVVMFLRKRANKDEETQDDDDFLPQTPSFTEDEPQSNDALDDPIIPDPLDDLDIQLDDNHSNDILPEEDIAFDDSLDDALDDEFSDSENLLDQD